MNMEVLCFHYNNMGYWSVFHEIVEFLKKVIIYQIFKVINLLRLAIYK